MGRFSERAVLSRQALRPKGYPGEPSRPFYLVYDVVPADGFDDYQWNCAKLPDRMKIGNLPSRKP